MDSRGFRRAEARGRTGAPRRLLRSAAASVRRVGIRHEARLAPEGGETKRAVGEPYGSRFQLALQVNEALHGLSQEMVAGAHALVARFLPRFEIGRERLDERRVVEIEEKR